MHVLILVSIDCAWARREPILAGAIVHGRQEGVLRVLRVSPKLLVEELFPFSVVLFPRLAGGQAALSDSLLLLDLFLSLLILVVFFEVGKAGSKCFLCPSAVNLLVVFGENPESLFEPHGLA